MFDEYFYSDTNQYYTSYWFCGELDVLAEGYAQGETEYGEE